MSKKRGGRTGVREEIGKRKNWEEGKGDWLIPPGGTDRGYRLREAGAEVVCCRCWGDVKVQKDFKFVSATRFPFSPDTPKRRTAATWVGSTHMCSVHGVARPPVPTAVGTPAELGTVVLLHTKTP